MPIFKIRDSLVNTLERLVIREGQIESLTTKSIDLLQLLIERKGQVVSKDEILGKVWAGLFVEESNLPVHISKIRQVLSHSKTTPVIDTIHGVGYRLACEVSEVLTSEWTRALRQMTTIPSTASPLATVSVAVLPIHIEEQDEPINQLVETDLLAAELMNGISTLASVKVLPRLEIEKLDSHSLTVAGLRRLLDVSLAIYGRVRRRESNVSISFDLVEVANGSHLWGTTLHFSSDDETPMRSRVLTELNPRIHDVIIEFRDRNVGAVSAVPESYRLYMKGRLFHNRRTKRDIWRAIEYLEQSISLDSKNLHSQTELIECYLSLYFSDYISHRELLIQIDKNRAIIDNEVPDLASWHSMFGAIKMYVEWDFELALKHFLRAIELDQTSVLTRYRLVNYLITCTRLNEALAELKTIQDLEPISASNLARIGRVFYKLDRYQDAIDVLLEANELEPNNFVVLSLLGASYIAFEDFDTALDFLNASLSIEHNVETLSLIGEAHALRGDVAAALAVLEALESEHTGAPNLSLKKSRVALALHDDAKAFEYLQEAVLDHDVDVLSIHSNKSWKRLSNHPAFASIVGGLGLPTTRLS